MAIFILSIFFPLLGNQGLKKRPRWARDTAIWLHSRSGGCPIPRLGMRFDGPHLGLSDWPAVGSSFDLCLPLHEDRYQLIPLRMDLDLLTHQLLGGLLVTVTWLPTENGILWQGDQQLRWNFWCLNAETTGGTN